MKNQTIEQTIEINTSLENVWKVFTDTEVTKQMGGYYETDWTPGSTFGFRKPDGTALTNGILLAFQPRQTITHNLFGSNAEDIIAVITYSFQAKGTHTLLTGREELIKPLSQAEYKDACDGWAAA
jgi:uncharacterized protein YndB with AHSA1/START domain